jgi:hypothetical protein
MTNLALDIPLFTRHPVLHPDTDDSLLSTMCRTRSLVDFNDFRVVGNNGAVLNCGHDQRNVHSRIIVLTVVVDDTADEAFRLEHRERLECLATAHPVGAFHVLRAGEDIV